jgi:hypothetical protein
MVARCLPAHSGRNRYTPHLDALGERLAPGDAVLGGLLGWGVIAAADVPVQATSAHNGLSHRASLLADLGGTDGLAALTEVDPAAEPASATAPSAGSSTDPPQPDPDPARAPVTPASRLVVEGQGNAASSAGVLVAAPPGPGSPAPAFAAVAGAGVQHLPSALAAAASRSSTGASTDNRAQVLDGLNRTGLRFERNLGQTDNRVDYLARTGGGTVFLTATAAVFAMQERSSIIGQPSAGLPGTPPEVGSTNAGVALDMDIVGANPASRPVGQDQLPGKLNYFVGSNPSKWHTDIPSYSRVEYPNVYAGISLAYYGGPGGLEYDFVLSPGADAHAIALRFEGASGVALDAQGDLVVHTAVGDLVQHAPILYQDVGGQRQPVAGRFTTDSGLVRFDVGAYDRSRPLVIDPLVLGYSTYLSGSAFLAQGERVAPGPDGSVYVAGYAGPDFPTTPGTFQPVSGGGYDAFVAKLAPRGGGQADLVWSTFLGGGGADEIHGLAVDGAGDVYAAGPTTSTDFPTTPGAFQSTYGGGAFDGFAAKISADGSSLLYGTYLGGSGDDRAEAVAVDAAGSAYVTGRTKSSDFPTTPGAFDPHYHAAQDVFVVKLTPAADGLAYGTYLGGNQDELGAGIAVDAAGAAYVTGYTYSSSFPTTQGAFDPTYNGGGDAFVVKLLPDGSGLAYSTFLGGSATEGAGGIAVDGAGDAYVTGGTNSPDFPVTPGAFQTKLAGDFDGYVAKLSPAGDGLVYSTYLGGTNLDSPYGIAVDASGSAFVAGSTASWNFPITPDAFQKTNKAGDGFLTQFKPDGSGLIYSTFLGGSAGDGIQGMAVDVSGNVFVTGITMSADFPTTPGAFQTTKHNLSDEYAAFLAQFKPGPRPHSAQGLRPPSPTVAPGRI